MTTALTRIELPLPKVASGKVRELFAVGDDLLFVAADRISAFDVVMTQGIPDKGRVLTAMSLFWFDLVKDICPNHLLAASVDGIPELDMHRDELHGRSMIVRKLAMLPLEFVVRGYLAGSGYSDYRATGEVCGIPLPGGLVEAAKLPEPIFTPATKAVTGHDLNITEDEAEETVGPAVLKRAKECAIALYERAADVAAGRGIILADTKFEFGVDDGEVVLADEVLTPDSSRFWPADGWVPGTSPPSFDKQPLRDWLDAPEGGAWNHEPPPPELPEELIEDTRARYVEAYERLTGTSFSGDSTD